MRIPSGVTDQYLYFVGVDATDLTTRETGLSSFTVVRSRNGAADATYTTPTVAEIDATTMPGVYALLLDEDMTLDAGDDSQEVCLHITHAGMAPVTRTFELYRPKITAGNTLDVSATGAAGLDFNNVELPVGAIPALGIIENGTMQAGSTASTAVLRAATSLADDLINGVVIEVTGGTGAGQVRVVTDWVSATDTATVSPDWGTTPDNTSTYIVRAAPPAPTATASLPPVNVAAWLGTAPATPTVAGVPEVDLTHVAGSTSDVSTMPASVAAILVDTGTTLQAELDGIQADTEDLQTRVPAALVGGRIDATVDATGMEAGAIAAILNDALLDSVPADGSLPTVRQALYMLTQFMFERSVSGTTLTVRKADGSTSLMTFTLSDATSPVSITRAT